MPELSAALEVALAAAGVARGMLLAECARPGGPRGEIGKCPADDEAEWVIRERLLSAFPGWGFLGEETGAQKGEDGQPVWIVDPNDGTSSMQRGARGHSVSIGLVHGGEPMLGVVWAVDAPDDDGDLIAWAAGCGPIRRNGVALASIAWPGELRSDDVVCLSQAAIRNPIGYQRCVEPARFVGVPSIAYRLALVAAGDCVATVTLNEVSAWDVAAGHALLRGAGGVMVDADGREVRYDADGRSRSGAVFGGGSALVKLLIERPWAGATGSGFSEATPAPRLSPVRARPGAKIHDTDRLARAHGCLLGQLAGDALGALVEFSSADQITRAYPRGGPRDLAAGGPHHILAGQPTDDSELALLLARTLVASDDFDQEAVAGTYAGWFHGWTHTDAPEPCAHAWCKPFDVGTTTAQALGAVRAGDVQAKRAAAVAMRAASQSSQANGGLMRVSPLGIWGARRDRSVVTEAARQDARLTHPNRVCQDASAVFVVSLAAAIGERLTGEQTYALALDFARGQGLDPAVLRAIEAARAGPPADFLTHQGWVLLALQNAYFRLLHAPTFEAGVIETVRAGGDTDTNAAICGALLGAVHGREAIPAQWRRMVLTCRPLIGLPGVTQPRPAQFWPVDALLLAERLLASVNAA